MGRYLLKRLAMTFLVVIVVMVFLSVLVHLVPGDPAKIILGPRATESLVATVRDEMGLDNPVHVQVWDFVTGALQGDLGRDFLSRVPVSELVLDALPHTIVLAVAAIGLAALLGIPLGVYAATKPNSLLDRVTAVVSVSLITMPYYIAGLFLLLLFSLKWRVFPAVGAGSFSDPLDYLRHLALPVAALALTWVGYIARLVRTSMLEVLGANYIRTARAFGLRERVVFYKYALKNAVIPTVAVVSVGLGELMGGAVFVEVIFSRPGLGRLAVEAIGTRNFPILQGTVLVIALAYVLTNLVADLSYRFLDPRIRVEETPAA
ncbi:MAG: ABC transporter permease [Actinomycetota bacterium]|nr:ABC transporter permease [Actinomycetota bacterium]